MLDVFFHSGFDVKSHYDYGEVSLSFRLSPPHGTKMPVPLDRRDGTSNAQMTATSTHTMQWMVDRTDRWRAWPPCARLRVTDVCLGPGNAGEYPLCSGQAGG